MVSRSLPAFFWHLFMIIPYASHFPIASAFSNERSDNVRVHHLSLTIVTNEVLLARRLLGARLRRPPAKVVRLRLTVNAERLFTQTARRLSFYCNDDTIDVIPMAFLDVFRGKGGLPVIDFSNICGVGSGRTFAGSDLTDCSFLEPDIRTCQAKGKIVTLSLGGAASQVGFSNDTQAEMFGQLIWDMFLGGKSDIRPLGNVPLDGIDLDIEKGSSAHYTALVNKIRSLAKGASKRSLLACSILDLPNANNHSYYITAAPQCPFPDEYIGTALNNAFFDAVYVQFYNNFCETSVPSEFNFETWDKWARNQSPNRDIKVYLGAPGDSSAAGDGYVNIGTLSKIATDAQGRYSSFGGVMLWDADAAYSEFYSCMWETKPYFSDLFNPANNRYDRAIKNALVGGTASTTDTKTATHATSTTSKEATTTSEAITTSLPKLILPFKDPRKTARVKRPQGLTLSPREVAPAQDRPVTSRFFRFLV